MKQSRLQKDIEHDIEAPAIGLEWFMEHLEKWLIKLSRWLKKLSG